MSLDKFQKDGFEERLKRINKGGKNTMGEVHIGPRDEAKARKGKTDKHSTVRLKKKKHKELGKGSPVVMMPIALLLGGLSMFVGQAAGYHLFGDGGLVPVELPTEALEPYVPYVPFVIAGVLATMFVWTFNLSTLMRKVAVIAGLSGVVYFEGDLIDRYPETYTNVFSELYVATAPEPKLPDLISQAVDVADANL